MATHPQRSIKLAGPDERGSFKVIQTKNTTIVFPGEVYGKEVLEQQLMPLTRPSSQHKIDINIVEPKADDLHLIEAGLDVFYGEVRSAIHR